MMGHYNSEIHGKASDAEWLELIKKRDAEIELLRGDLKNSKACWDAACNDIDRLQAENAKLRKDITELTEALDAAIKDRDYFHDLYENRIKT